MPTSGQQESNVNTFFVNGVSQYGKSGSAEADEADKPRLDAGEVPPRSRLTRREEPGPAGLAGSASPKEPQRGDPQSVDSGKGSGDEGGADRYAAYWKKLKKITVVWMLAWTVPAILMHLPIGATRQITVLNGIPLHWFNAAFLSIVVGIALIFIYAYAMERTDRGLKGD